MHIDVQPIPARGPWRAHVAAVQAAEAAGFTTVWAVDHYTGAPFGGSGMPETFVQLAALAQSTTTMGLGTMVVNVANRTAAHLAHVAAGLQVVSGGRFVLGVGAGTSPSAVFAGEQRAVGVEPHPTLQARHQHLHGVVAAVRHQWRTAPDDPFAGFTTPVPEPPVIVGVNSAPLAAWAGAHADGINVRWDAPHRDACIAAALAARSGRANPPSWWTTSVWAPWHPSWCDAGSEGRLALAGAGVDRLVLMWIDPPHPHDVLAAGEVLAATAG